MYRILVPVNLLYGIGRQASMVCECIESADQLFYCVWRQNDCYSICRAVIVADYSTTTKWLSDIFKLNDTLSRVGYRGRLVIVYL